MIESQNGGTKQLTYREDDAHTSADAGVMALAVRKDTAAALAGTDGDYIPLIVDNTGRLYVAPLVAGTATIGNVGEVAITTGGCSSSRVVSSGASADKTAVKASAGKVYAIQVTNVNAAIRWLQLYDVASASVTVGTTTPLLSFGIPGNTAGGGFTLPVPAGIGFSTAITLALTTTAGGSTSVTSGEVVCNLLYS